MDIKENALDAIGNTPLVRLARIKERFGLKADIYAKLERANPTGSIKDRIAKEMILSALKDGRIEKGTVIVLQYEGPKGGPGMREMLNQSLRCRSRPHEGARRDGRGGQGRRGLCRKPSFRLYPGAVREPRQWQGPLSDDGPGNLSPARWKDRRFRRRFRDGRDVDGYRPLPPGKNTVYPSRGTRTSFLCIRRSSPFVTRGKKGAHKIQGIGAGFKPGVLDLSVVDDVLTVSDEDAYSFTRLLCQEEGLFCGISSGCNLFGAVQEAKREDNAGKTIVTILPDDGERYLSVEGLYD